MLFYIILPFAIRGNTFWYGLSYDFKDNYRGLFVFSKEE